MHDNSFNFWEMTKDEFNDFCNEYYIKKDLQPDISGLLLSQHIKFYVNEGKMIQPFDENYLKPAAYKLRIGPYYAKGNPPKKMKKIDHDSIILKPFEVAIISTYEMINLPYNIIARWNLRVDMVYKGLLWTGALQVDPGWCGPLYCPIYNLSDKTVDLFFGKEFVTMDFIKSNNVDYSEKENYYKNRGNGVRLKEYKYNLRSALVSDARDRMDRIDNRVSRFETYIGLIFACIAVLFTGLTILVTSFDVNDVSDINRWNIIWMTTAVATSLVALFLVFWLRTIDLIKKTKIKIIILILLICSISFMFYLIYPRVSEIISSFI